MKILRRPWAKLTCWRVMRDERGASGVEFALIAPVLLLILGGIFEIGLMIRAKFDVVSVVSAAANQTLSIGDTISEGSAEMIAASLVALLAGNDRSATVNINNAVTARLVDGQVTVTETGAEVSACYCAARTDDLLVWGSAVQCGNPCGHGTVSGRFVGLRAEASSNTSLSLYGFFTEDVISSTAVVRLP